jgi:hypothetical protein
VNATGTRKTVDGVTTDIDATTDKDLLSKRWAQGDEASGGNLNELVLARGKVEKGSAKYAAIQNKINEALGSKKVHEATETTKGGETRVVKPEGTRETVITDDKGTEDPSDDTTSVEDRMKGLGRKKGKTLEYTRKVAEQERISKEREDIRGAKASGDRAEKLQSQKEISEIKSGRDDAKTGTMLSRWWHKGRAKRKGKKLTKEEAKNA